MATDFFTPGGFLLSRDWKRRMALESVRITISHQYLPVELEFPDVMHAGTVIDVSVISRVPSRQQGQVMLVGADLPDGGKRRLSKEVAIYSAFEMSGEGIAFYLTNDLEKLHRAGVFTAMGDAHWPPERTVPLSAELAAILTAYAAGEMPGEILADFLEERGDPRAAAVRAQVGKYAPWQAVGTVAHVLALFPDYNSSLQGV